MATILFYEKPGCVTNARQRSLLESAGHDVLRRSLLAEPWSAERLLEFFKDLPVPAWFNPASPRIKSGEIDPRRLTRDAALSMLLSDRLLIRRPLIESDSLRIVGFDPVQLQAHIDLRGLQPQGDPQACSRTAR